MYDCCDCYCIRDYILLGNSSTQKLQVQFILTESKKRQTTHEMEIQVFSTEICTKWYTFDQRLVEPFGQDQIDRELMFCAGLPQRGQVPCTVSILLEF